MYLLVGGPWHGKTVEVPYGTFIVEEMLDPFPWVPPEDDPMELPKTRKWKYTARRFSVESDVLSGMLTCMAPEELTAAEVRRLLGTLPLSLRGEL